MGSKKKRTIRKKSRRPSARRSKSKRKSPITPVTPINAAECCRCDGDNCGETPCVSVPERGDGVCCTVCGSLEVQFAVWYRPNGGMQDFEPFGSWNAGDNTFCSDCDRNERNPNPPLVDESADPDDYLSARSLRLGDGRGDTFIPPKFDTDGKEIAHV